MTFFCMRLQCKYVHSENSKCHVLSKDTETMASKTANIRYKTTTQQTILGKTDKVHKK